MSWILGILLLLPQEPEKPRAEREVVVTSSPLKPTDLFDTPYSADVVGSRQIQEERLSRNIPDALRETPGVSVQKTAYGHGSPYLRGFTGFRNLFLIDGIRLNNAIFRDGPNQYWNTVDEFLVDRMEIVRGPSSVLYGSDSIGGTVAVTTTEPARPGTEGAASGRSYYRFASAERSHTAREEARGGTGDTAWGLGATYRDFHDLRGGRETGTMRNTGFDEYDADVKLVHWAEKDEKITFAYQRARQDDVPRTHRTVYSKSWHGTSVGTDLRSDYDQERDLAYLQYRAETRGGLSDAWEASLSWHHMAEEFRRTRSNNAREFRALEVSTPGVWVKSGKETGAGYVTVGAEYYHDEVGSRGKDISAGGVETPFTRGEVADDATYDLYGVYVQDEVSFGSLDVVPGIRFTRAEVDAGEVDPNPGDAIVFSDVEDRYQAVTGSLRLLYHLDESWNLIAGWGQGFRTPTLDDSTAVKLVQSGALDLPADDLDPERSQTVDLGARTKADDFELSLFGFYTWLSDFIRRVPSIDYNGDGTVDNTKDNFADGWVYGFELSASWRLCREWTLWGDAGYAKGAGDALVGGVKREQPLDKMNPMTGHLGLRYNLHKGEGPPILWCDALATMARHQEHLSPGDETDTQRIPPGGTPGYTVYGIRFGIPAPKKDSYSFTIAVENLTNKDYRVHGSGQNEPGRSVIVGIDVRF